MSGVGDTTQEDFSEPMPENSEENSEEAFSVEEPSGTGSMF